MTADPRDFEDMLDALSRGMATAMMQARVAALLAAHAAVLCPDAPAGLAKEMAQ